MKNKAVGERIKSIRKAKGLTAKEFGKIIKAPQSAVSNWENGANLPNNERLKKIASISGMSVNQLLYGDPKVYLDNLIFASSEVDEYSNESFNAFYEELKNSVEDENNLYLSEEEAVKQYNKYTELNPVFTENNEILENIIFGATFNFYQKKKMDMSSDTFEKTLEEAVSTAKDLNIKSFDEEAINNLIPIAHKLATTQFLFEHPQGGLIALLKKLIIELRLEIMNEENMSEDLINEYTEMIERCTSLINAITTRDN